MTRSTRPVHFLNKAQAIQFDSKTNTARILVNKGEARELFENVQQANLRFETVSPVHMENEYDEVMALTFYCMGDWFSFYQVV